MVVKLPAYATFNVLVIDSDMKSRTKIKTVARAVNCFESINGVDSLIEGLQYLRSAKPCDIVFVSEAFDKAQINEFLAEAMTTSTGDLCSYVMAMKTSDPSQEIIAANVMMGFNGFLLEPYSADGLNEIAGIAQKIRKEKFAKRIRAASKMVVSTLVKEVKRLAALTALGENAHVCYEAERAADLVKHLRGEARDTYVDVLVDMFGSCPPPKPVDYGGASSRVKKTIEKKEKTEIAKKMEEEIKADAANLDEGTFGHPLAKAPKE
jgi:DNA-binding NarL/FixJ family response regulator